MPAVTTVACCVCLVPSAATSEAIYSWTAGATCQRTAANGSNVSRCRGPAGYFSLLVERDRVMSINFGHTASANLFRRQDSLDLLWRGLERLIDERIEWRLARGRPFAAIVRIFTLTESDRPLQQFLIAKVTHAGACELARVNVMDDNAQATARDLADSQASVIECRTAGPP